MLRKPDAFLILCKRPKDIKERGFKRCIILHFSKLLLCTGSDCLEEVVPDADALSIVWLALEHEVLYQI